MKKIYRIILIMVISGLLLYGCRSDDFSDIDGQETQSSYYMENKGSDTIVNLALNWAERYQLLHPEVSVSVTGGGSGTGISSLINNTVDIANASRQIKTEEISAAEANEVFPLEHIIARDAIAVIVNPNNPINQLTLQQISDIYTAKINNWSELGGEDRPIVRLSRETNSGTHVYFLEAVIRLGNKDDKTIFSADTLLLPSSEGIIAEVRDNPNAIGYDGLGYISSDVKVLKISKTPGGEYIYPSIETVNQNLYPISRDLYMYTNGIPEKFIQDYLDWILSDDGQQVVFELGFVPVN